MVAREFAARRLVHGDEREKGEERAASGEAGATSSARAVHLSGIK